MLIMFSIFLPFFPSNILSLISATDFIFSVVYSSWPLLFKKCLSLPVLKQIIHSQMHVITLCWFEHTIVRNNFELFPSSVQFSFSPSHHKWWIFHITVDLWKYVIKMETKNSIKYFSLDFQYYVLSAFHFLSLWAGTILLDPPPLFFWRIKKQKFLHFLHVSYYIHCLLFVYTKAYEL